ncbi:hypothetical protein HHI36_016265, partial [Cryptolaemus montrouzieri]
SGVFCHFEMLFKAFITSLREVITSELDMADQLSSEEWEAIRPSKSKQRTSLLEKVGLYLKSNEYCNNCTRWIFKSGDTWGYENDSIENNSSIRLLKTGSWTPTVGVKMSEELFLNVAYGFRGRKLRLATIHVSSSSKGSIIFT